MSNSFATKKRTLNLRDMSANGNGANAQESNTRKILMDLQQEKKRLRMMQGNQSGGGPALLPTPPIRPSLSNNMPPNPPMDPAQHMAAQQRKAMQMAHATSFGYFIPQDSAFGNVILPVIPRVGPRVAPD